MATEACNLVAIYIPKIKETNHKMIVMHSL